MKIGAKILFACIMAAMVCACGEKAKESEVTDTEKKTDRSAFASGMTSSSEDVKEMPEPGKQVDKASDAPGGQSVPEDQSAKEPDGTIVERCPANILAKRDDVSYGEFFHGTYDSETCGMERGYSVLLPAGYSEEKKYPVLYLLHGIFGDEYSFSGDPANGIREIVGNMAADGLIEETIIVCPNMYAATDPEQKPAFDAESVLPYDNFINDLVNDLMPYIESHYSVLTGRENTYLAGFSMGGRETIFITLQRPELFGYVCAISAAPGIVPTTDKFMTHTGQMKEDEMKFAPDAVLPEVFIICCGTGDSVVGEYPKSYHEILEANSSAHIWYEINGADHDNNAIRSGLFNLFRQIAYRKNRTQ